MAYESSIIIDYYEPKTKWTNSAYRLKNALFQNLLCIQVFDNDFIKTDYDGSNFLYPHRVGRSQSNETPVNNICTVLDSYL